MLLPGVVGFDTREIRLWTATDSPQAPRATVDEPERQLESGPRRSWGRGDAVVQPAGGAGRPARVPQGVGAREVWVRTGSVVPVLVASARDVQRTSDRSVTPPQPDSRGRCPVAPSGCLMAWAVALGQPPVPAAAVLWTMVLGLVTWGAVAHGSRSRRAAVLAPGWVGAAWWATAAGAGPEARALGACGAVLVAAWCLRIVHRRPDPAARGWGAGAGALAVVVGTGTTVHDLPFTAVMVAVVGVALTRCAPALAWWPSEGWLLRLPASAARSPAPSVAAVGGTTWRGWTGGLLRGPVAEARAAATLGAALGSCLGVLGMVLGAVSVRAGGVSFEQAALAALMVAWWWGWVRRSGLESAPATGWLFGVAAGGPLVALAVVGTDACGAAVVAAIAWGGGLALAWTAARGTRTWDLLWWPGCSLRSTAVASSIVGVVVASGLVARAAGLR